MLATFMTAMQAENAKLASNLESKLNKLSDDLDAKLASVSESLNTKLNSVSDRLDANINLMIAGVTAEMKRENNQIRQEFSMQLQTEVQLITEKVEVVRNSTDTELTNCVKNFEGECNKISGNLNDYKS
jgi:DNA anti-recombination protein RmuC